MSQTVKDTHGGSGGDGSDSANRDGLLGVPQVARAVGARHDTCTTQKKTTNIHNLLFNSWPTCPFLSPRYP